MRHFDWHASVELRQPLLLPLGVWLCGEFPLPGFGVTVFGERGSGVVASDGSAADVIGVDMDAAGFERDSIPRFAPAGRARGG